MRFLTRCCFLLAVGCGATPIPAERQPAAPPPVAAEESSTQPTTVTDLRTRTSGSDWPAFLGPTRDSVSSEKGLRTPWPEEGPRLVWQQTVGTGYGMPSVSLGRLFHFDRVGNRARLRCLKSETGEPLWKFEYTTDYEDDYGFNNGPRCSPVVDDDRVYIYGAEGMLHCLTTLEGRLLWKVDTKTDFHVVQNFFGVGSTPVIEGDLLIAQVGGSPEGEVRRPGQKGNGSGVVAFDKRTGKVKYRATDELASYAVPVLATIDGRRWCFVFARGGLIGMDPVNGKVDFHFPWRARNFESVNAANPVVVGDRVFISETYGPGCALLRVKPGACQVAWSDDDRRDDKSMQCHWNTPIHHAGYLYGSSGRHSHNAELRCIELATGKVMWSVPELTRCSLLMVDGHFICMGENGHLRLLKVNPQKYEELSHLVLRRENAGEERAALLLKPPCWEAPILAHGLLYVRGADRLVCLEVIAEKK